MLSPSPSSSGLPTHNPDRLVALRGHKGLTQQPLSDQTGIHVTQIHRYEAGKAEPTLEILRNLSAASESPATPCSSTRPSADLSRRPAACTWRPATASTPPRSRPSRRVVDGLLLKHEARRWVRSA